MVELHAPHADGLGMSSQAPPGWDGPDETHRPGLSQTASARRSGRAYVVAPDGAKWTVRRRGLTRVRLNWTRWRPDTLTVLGGVATPDSDLSGWLLGTALILAVLLVLVPLLLFGVELVIAGGVIAVGLLGRLLLGRPWIVEAAMVPAAGAPRSLEWQVKGWRGSAEMVRRVASDIEAGRDPLATEGVDAR